MLASILTFVSISAVVQDKGGCFLPEKATYCGNNLIEIDEQCDCGGLYSKN